MNSFSRHNLFKSKEKKNFEDIILFEKNLNLTLKKFEDFRSINNQNKLLEDKIKLKKQKIPDITIIITIYNQAHCLFKCLRSIQNQSLKNIEIIIVDDCSLDNSSEIIEEFQKEDPRIIFIEHEANEGTIKARSDGIRKAKGKYITIIDGDDAFIHKDILKNSLYIAQKANIDVVEFQIGIYKDESFFGRTKNYPDLNLTYIVQQPELRTKFILTFNNFPGDLRNRGICGKLIKKELFNKILLYIGKEFTDDFIIEAEDTIMAISILHLANSYYLMKELGYYYSIDKNRKNFSKSKNKLCKPNNKIKNFSFFKFLKFLVGKTDKNEKEQIMAYKEITTYINYNYYFNNFQMKKEHYEILFYIFNKTLEFEFLNKNQKDEIMLLKNRTIEKKKENKKQIFISLKEIDSVKH